MLDYEVLLQRADLCALDGDLLSARSHALEAQRLARAGAEPFSLALTHLVLGTLASPTPGGDLTDLREASRIATESSHLALSAVALCEAAIRSTFAGRRDLAEECLWTASQQIGRTPLVQSLEYATLQYTQGHILLHHGESSQAVSCFAEAAWCCQPCLAMHCGEGASGVRRECQSTDGGLVSSRFWCLHARGWRLYASIFEGWGESLLEHGQFEAADHYLQEAIRLHRQVPVPGQVEPVMNRPAVGRCTTIRARLLLARGQVQEAWALLDSERAFQRPLGSTWDLGANLNRVGEIALRNADFGKSRAMSLRCLDEVPDQPVVRFHARVGLALTVLAQLDVRRSWSPGELQAAHDQLTQAEAELGRVPPSTRKELLGRWLDAVTCFVRWRSLIERPGAELGEVVRKMQIIAQDLKDRNAMHHAADVLEEVLKVGAEASRVTMVGPGVNVVETMDSLMTTLERIGASRRMDLIERGLRHDYPKEYLLTVLGRLVPGLEPGHSSSVVPLRLTVLSLDIRGFSTITREMPPEEVFSFLTEVFRVLNEAVIESRGLIIHYVGDALLAVFGNGSPETGPAQALACTLKILVDIEAYNIRCRQEHQSDPSRPSREVEIGMALHVGKVAFGRLLALGRWDHTIHGDTVNAAAHLEQQTKKLGTRLLVTQETLEAARAVPCEAAAYETVTLKHERLILASRVRPLIRFRPVFVGMGVHLEPRPGVLALDVGGRAEPGVMDHHQAPIAASSASLVTAHPEWVTLPFQGESWKGWDKRPIFVLHHHPDFDCTLSAYLAQRLLDDKLLPRVAAQMARYADQIDQGKVPVTSHPDASPYMLFEATAFIGRREAGARGLTGQARDRLVLERGLFLMHCLARLLEEHPELDPAEAFLSPHPFQEEAALVRQDQERYIQDCKAASFYDVSLPLRESAIRAPELMIEVHDPTSILFKVWARQEGIIMQHVIYRPRKDFPLLKSQGLGLGRQVVSVDPSGGHHLPDLGARLDLLETEHRARVMALTGFDLRRDLSAPRLGYQNADPWYDGRGHDHTIVDAPVSGTILGTEQVRDLLTELFDARAHA